MKIDWEKNLQPAGMTLENFAFCLSLLDYTYDDIGELVDKSPEWVSEAVRRHEQRTCEKSAGDE